MIKWMKIATVGAVLALSGGLIAGLASEESEQPLWNQAAFTVGPAGFLLFPDRHDRDEAVDVTGEESDDLRKTLSAPAGCKKIALNVDFAEVTVLRGQTLSVRLDAANEQIRNAQSVSDSAENGIWTIDIESFSSEDWADNFAALSAGMSVTVYVPDHLDALEIEGGACSATLEGIHVKKADVSVDAGEVVVFDSGFDTLELDTDAGSMHLQTVEAGTAKLIVDAGSITAELVSIASGLEASADLGSVDLNLVGSPKDYGYDLKAELGRIALNDQPYKANQWPDLSKKDCSIKASVSLGDIEITFVDREEMG